MDGSRCFIQFSHPGREHVPDRDDGKSRNKGNLSHRRKFMQFRGKWIDPEGGRRTGDLYAWDECEPESDLSRNSDNPVGILRIPVTCGSCTTYRRTITRICTTPPRSFSGNAS